MKIQPLVPGVVRTAGKAAGRPAFEKESRQRLGDDAVLIRWEWDGRDHLTIWWATSKVDVASLAGCAEMAGEGTRLKAAGDTLVIETDAPHIWVGKAGWRVRALQDIWGVHIKVQTAVDPRPAPATIPPVEAARVSRARQKGIPLWRHLAAMLSPRTARSSAT